MRALIVTFVFAIGIFLAMPSTSSGSCSPPDQVSFVVGHFDIAPVMANVQDYTFVAYQSQLAPAAIELQEKGGTIVEKSLNTSLNVGYNFKNAIVTTTDLMLRSDYCRLCRPILMANQRQNIRTKNIQLHDPVKIRADSKG